MKPAVFTLTLTEEERVLLHHLLEHALRDKGVEAHRTKVLDYRKHVEEEEAILRDLMDKLERR
jgi:hypothetical protein